jgi:hypothetical protein
VQLNLVEAGITWGGRWVVVGLRGEVEVPVAGHDDVHLIAQRCDGKFVGRVEGCLRRDERPGADAWVLLGERGDGGGEAEEDQCANCSVDIDGINVADSKWAACALCGRG